MEKFPRKVFETASDKQFGRTIRPPTKAHLGEKLRQSDLLTTTVGMFNDQFSEARGLPTSIPSKDPKKKPDLERKEDGTLKPVSTTKSAGRYRVKLQKQPDIKSVCRMQERKPGVGMDASLLVLPPKKLLKLGHLGKKVAMAAPPLVARAWIPRGSARLERLPTWSYKMNVVMMDENADVTFGVKEYEAPVRARLP
jgi:hypothetical protein